MQKPVVIQQLNGQVHVFWHGMTVQSAVAVKVCVHKFAALRTSAVEALYHVHVVSTDCPLHSPVSLSVPPPLHHVSMCNHILNRVYHLLFGHAVLCMV